MKLYSMAPQDRSGRVRWLLNELNVPYEDVILNYKAGDLKADSYLAKQPMGQVPVLEDGDLRIYESQGIVAYLADKYIDKGLAPSPQNLAERALYYQWMFFSASTVESFFWRYSRLARMSAEYREEWGSYIQDKTQRVFMNLENQLKDKEYVLGRFSAVDVCLGYELDNLSEDPIFNDYPRVKAYFERLSKREACLKAEVFKRD